jgi:hypothetical protein
MDNDCNHQGHDTVCYATEYPNAIESISRRHLSIHHSAQFALNAAAYTSILGIKPTLVGCHSRQCLRKTTLYIPRRARRPGKGIAAMTDKLNFPTEPNLHGERVKHSLHVVIIFKLKLQDYKAPHILGSFGIRLSASVVKKCLPYGYKKIRCDVFGDLVLKEGDICGSLDIGTILTVEVHATLMVIGVQMV